MSTNDLEGIVDTKESYKKLMDFYNSGFYKSNFLNLCYRLTGDPEYLPKKLTKEEELQESKIREARWENEKRIMASDYNLLTPEEIKYKVGRLANDVKYLLSKRTEFLEWDRDGANADLDSLIKDYEKFLNTKELDKYIGNNLVTTLSAILGKYKQIKDITNEIENL